MKISRVILIALLAVAVASCCSCRRSGKKAVSILGTEWQLVQMETRAFSPADDSFTVKFAEDNRLSGKGDCNRLMGGYEIPSPGQLTFKGLASTRMLCPNDADEMEYIRLLESANRYEVDGSMLILFNGEEMVLMFEAVK